MQIKTTQEDKEQIPENPKVQQEPQKTKIFRRTRKMQNRTTSRQFNNPIYAGFDLFEENKQSTLWGPWVENREKTPLQKSHSLHAQKKFKITTFHFKTKKTQEHIHERKAPSQLKLPIRNQLPQIKQKTIQTLKQIRFSSLELLPKETEFSPKPTHPKSKKALADTKRLKYELQLREEYLKKAKIIGDVGKTLKMGTVVYNYCTDHNAQGSLLEYHRKKMNDLVKPVIENLESSEKKIEKWKNNEKLLKKINSNRHLY